MGVTVCVYIYIYIYIYRQHQYANVVSAHSDRSGGSFVRGMRSLFSVEPGGATYYNVTSACCFDRQQSYHPLDLQQHLDFSLNGVADSSTADRMCAHIEMTIRNIVQALLSFAAALCASGGALPQPLRLHYIPKYPLDIICQNNI